MKIVDLPGHAWISTHFVPQLLYRGITDRGKEDMEEINIH